MEEVGSLLSVGANWSQPFSSEVFGQHLRITALHDPPYLFVSQLANGSFQLDGYLYDIWMIIKNELQLNFTIHPNPEGGFGSMDENGTWSGMVGELAYKRADLALSVLNMRQDRASVIDYIGLVPVQHEVSTFYVRQGSGGAPGIGSDMFSPLMKPLHQDVWWMLLASMLVLSVMLRVSLRFSHARAESRQTVEEMTWSSCLLSSFSSLVGQGWATVPDSLAARTVTISSWLLGILIYASYTTNLITHLAVATVDKPISSLREFSEQPDWMLAMAPGHAILNNWRTSSDPYKRELYWRATNNDRFIELDWNGPAARRITQHQVMTFNDIIDIRYSLGAAACQLVPLLDTPPQKMPGFLAMAKGKDEVRQAINHVLLKLQNSGTLS